MRKRILSIALAASIAISTATPAHAEVSAEFLEETTSSAELSSGLSSGLSSNLSSGDHADVAELENPDTAEGSSEGAVIGVVALLAIGGLIAGGVNWAIQERLIPNPLPGIIPGPPAPSPAPQPASAPQRNVPAPAPAPAPTPARTDTVYYKNCTAVWNALNRPIYRDDAGFRAAHDRNRDGVGCESDPR
ncbi:excalibur calcium-binding domain-containing protein [Corynebacterium halotolerans]|uniref:excalibur calcium-binding domain-containing protein n=1 Tax=Corynebacterium halotolerans TaxID=225326 RepID=UPI003CF7B17A